MNRIVYTLAICASLPLLLIEPAAAQDSSPSHRPRHRVIDDSPEQKQSVPVNPKPARFPFEYRSIDGYGNNPNWPDAGTANDVLQRLADAAYADGIGAPNGAGRPSARAISNLCAAQTELEDQPNNVSSMFWQWGQFLDHDIDLVPIADPAEPFAIPVPAGDSFFDPGNTGAMTILLDRSHGEAVDGVRQQINEITAFIDGSVVYGSDADRAAFIRAFDGAGRLKTSEGNLLPFNEDGLPNAMSTSAAFFLGGDFRANEQAALTAMHTLWVREHNLWASIIHFFLPFLDGDTKYEWARAIVGAEIQAITYNEFLPLLLGPDALPPYTGYKADVHPGIANEFATATYRFGHTMLPPELLRLGRDGASISEGPLPLADSFFNPANITSIGIDPYIRGLAMQNAQRIDMKIIDGVRNFLFGPPGAGGFDLASLNIQRGRDHGLPDYNSMRAAMGLPRVQSFAEITPDVLAQAELANAYGTVDNIDLWVGGLAEWPKEGAMVGPTFHAIITDQFTALRDGDRFWYKTYLPRFLVRVIDGQTLASVIRRNSGIGFEIGRDAFHVDR